MRKYRNILGKLWESVGNPWEDVGKGKGLAKSWKTMKTFSEWSFTVYLRAYSFLRHNDIFLGVLLAEAEVSSQQ